MIENKSKEQKIIFTSILLGILDATWLYVFIMSRMQSGWIHTLFESSCSHLILDASLLENVLTGNRVIAWKLCKYGVSRQGVKSEGKVKRCIMAPSGAIYAYKKKQR